ncbi:TatD family hydrolase [Natrialbaceae archaeon A-CW1-1]
MGKKYPTKRAIAQESLESEHKQKVPVELINIPWIDIHNHAHTITWEEREQFALMGCTASVMMAYAIYYAPYRPVSPDDVRFLWDQALFRADQIERSHFYETKIGVGIHTATPVENYEDLIEVMPQYCELDEVVAIGEIGITNVQHVEQWDIETQRDVNRKQMEIAAKYDLPVIIHTPAHSDVSPLIGKDGGPAYYEVNQQLRKAPILSSDEPDLEAVKIDLEVASDAGLPEENLVFSHADMQKAPFILEETDANVSFTMTYPWVLDVDARDVAAAIEEYGSDRVLMETDRANIIRGNVKQLKRAILDLYRLGVDIEDIRKVIYENPSELLDLSQQ